LLAIGRDTRPLILTSLDIFSATHSNIDHKRARCRRYYLNVAASLLSAKRDRQENDMAESVYKVIELIGTSTDSWEMAAKSAVDRAAKSLRDLRVAEVVQLDLQMNDGKIEAYRAKLKVSFKFES
jgi:dodecin